MGTTTGSWAARIPGVRNQVRISDAQCGLATIAATAGSLVSLIVVLATWVRVPADTEQPVGRSAG